MKTILLVDDDNELRTCTKAALAPIGALILEAANGAEAMELIKQQIPHVIVTDIRMPIVDGLDLATKLKKDKVEIPIIFISGFVDKEMAISALRTGCFDLIEKPFKPRDLITSIRNALIKCDNVLFERLQALTLSTLQARILEMLLRGHSNKEIGNMINLSEQGVKYHISHLLKKFGTPNRRELRQKVRLLVSDRPQDHEFFSDV